MASKQLSSDRVAVGERDAALLAGVEARAPFGFDGNFLFLIPGLAPEWSTVRQRLRKLAKAGLVRESRGARGERFGYVLTLAGERALEVWRAEHGDPRWPGRLG